MILYKEYIVHLVLPAGGVQISLRNLDPFLLLLKMKLRVKGKIAVTLRKMSCLEILWSIGILSEPITDGFYSGNPVRTHFLYIDNSVYLEEIFSLEGIDCDRRLKEMFDLLPTLEESSRLEAQGLRADIILVNVQKEKKLLMLKQLILALVRGLNSNTTTIIKNIAGLVRIFQLITLLYLSNLVF